MARILNYHMKIFFFSFQICVPYIERKKYFALWGKENDASANQSWFV